jgi:hypothetical protein
LILPPDLLCDADIEAVGLGLLDRSLPKPRWTHAAHFAAAVWLVAARPDIQPEAEMPDIIRRYNVAVGGENTDVAGYHETITQASLRAVRAYVRPGATLIENLRTVVGSPCGDKDWLFAYWSRPVLFSVQARRAWVEPDLAPLPF